MARVDVSVLKTSGFVNLTCPPDLMGRIGCTVGSWILFCSLPKEIKRRFAYIETSDRGDTGFELKDERGDKRDLKEDFHVNLADLPRLQQIADNAPYSTYSSVTRLFLGDANSALRSVQPLVADFSRAVEGTFEVRGLTREVLGCPDRWVLRFLHYFGDRVVGEEAASAHADKSGFTLHLFESHPGVQYLNWGKQWNDVPISDGETIVIPGMQLQLRSRNELKALCHRVVTTEKTARAGRYSLVCFIPFLKTPQYDKSGKGRAQELPPGFNYDTPREEFRKSFV